MSSLTGGSQLGRFLAIGGLGTAAYLIAYFLLRADLSAHIANVAARVAIAVPTTWLNGRHTFRRQTTWQRLVLGSLAVLAVSTFVSSGLLALEQWRFGEADRMFEVAVLIGANAIATALRFLLLRHWLFRASSDSHSPAQRTRPAVATITPKRYA